MAQSEEGTLIGKMLLRILCASASILWAWPCSGLELDPDQVSWSRLYFEFSDGGSSATTEIQLDSVPAAELLRSPASSPDGAFTPAADADLRLLTANIWGTKGFWPFSGKRLWQTRVWFIPGNALPVRRIRWKFGDAPYTKTYRYVGDKVFRRRAEPNDRGEADGEPENWTEIKNSIYAFTPTQFGCSSISDTSLLLYVLAAVGFSEDTKPLHFCLFNKQSLYYAEFRVMGLERLQVSCVAKLEDAENSVNDEIDTLRILVTARAGDAAGEPPEPFEVLILRGDIEIFLDETTRLPVRIRGNVPDLGDIDLRLTEATLSKSKAEPVP